MLCSKKSKADLALGDQTLHLKIPSTINNPAVEAQTALHLQSRNRGTKNKTKKIKFSYQVPAKHLMQSKRKRKVLLASAAMTS